MYYHASCAPCNSPSLFLLCPLLTRSLYTLKFYHSIGVKSKVPEVVTISDNESEDGDDVMIVDVKRAEEEEASEAESLTEEEQQIIDDNLVWRKHSPYLYDTLLTHEMKHNSLTCQWLPGKEAVAVGMYTEQRLIMGTQTEKNELNELIITKVLEPRHSNIYARTPFHECSEIEWYLS